MANVIVDNGKDDDEDDTFVVDDSHLQQNHIDAVSGRKFIFVTRQIIIRV